MILGGDFGLGWLTHVSESGHRLLLPLQSYAKDSTLVSFFCGQHQFVYDRRRREIQLGPSFAVSIEHYRYQPDKLQADWLDMKERVAIDANIKSIKVSGQHCTMPTTCAHKC